LQDLISFRYCYSNFLGHLTISASIRWQS